MDLIRSREWDVVVLQEYSLRPAYDEDQICRDTVTPLNTLVNLIKDSSPDAIIQVSEYLVEYENYYSNNLEAIFIKSVFSKNNFTQSFMILGEDQPDTKKIVQIILSFAPIS